MRLCTLLLASTVSLGANVSLGSERQDFSLEVGDANVCVVGGPSAGRCYARPFAGVTEFDVRSRLERFDELFDDSFQPKPAFQKPPSLPEFFNRTTSSAAGAGLTTVQRRHLLGTYSSITVDQLGIGRDDARELTRDDGVKVLEIPFVARVVLTSARSAATESVALRGRLEIPADTQGQIEAKQVRDQAAVNATYASVIELDASSPSSVDLNDVLNEVGPAVLAQLHAELLLRSLAR